LRDHVQKKMSKYIKMGVIIHTPTSNIYASIYTSEITITKNYRQTEDSNLICEYNVSSAFNVFTNEDEYRNRTREHAYNPDNYVTHISINSNTFPTNPHTLLYDKFKLGLHSYTDDI